MSKDNNQRKLDIMKSINEYRESIAALYSLYNNACLAAENNRSLLTQSYEEMIDHKNDLNTISISIANVKKSERAEALTKYRAKVKKLKIDIQETFEKFKATYDDYKVALKDCTPLRDKYKAELSKLCKEFKAITKQDEDIYKGYKQQIKFINNYLQKIEVLISDYNVKKNKTIENKEKFKELRASADSIIERLA